LDVKQTDEGQNGARIGRPGPGQARLMLFEKKALEAPRCYHDLTF
jgi:hypothetical protein